MPLKFEFSFLTLGIFLANEWCLSSAVMCGDGYTFCDYSCCYDYDMSAYDCCLNVAYAWWFWFIFGMILLVVLLTCCAIVRRRQLRRRQVVIVQHGYNAPAVYGTLINTETPQQPYTQSGYNQYGGYAQPPPMAAPPYQPPAAAVQPAQPVVQAVKQNYDPNEKPPPYNPIP